MANGSTWRFNRKVRKDRTNPLPQRSQKMNLVEPLRLRNTEFTCGTQFASWSFHL